MTESETLVYVDLYGNPNLVGRLWTRTRKEKDSATFEYDRDWLSNPLRFALQPTLPLGPGSFHSGDSALFGAIGDSAPDRWGRVLMRLAERRRAEREGKTPRSLREIDYLLMVNDVARQGALRFAQKAGGPFLADDAKKSIPPLIELPKLLSASNRVLNDQESDEDLRLLLAPGSSLGGARPKASVLDRDGHLAIAKFPHEGDEINTVLWEAVALTLASKAGIDVPEWRLENVGKRSVLLLRRFDRREGSRIPFVSSMSMLDARDNEPRSYMEFVDVLRQVGAAPKDDMRKLWRRIVFSILISNTDDHLRNHGFLHSDPAGWRLSPAYDLNPVPIDIKPRVLSTTIDLDDASASLELAKQVASYFEISDIDSHQIAYEVGTAVATWRSVAAQYGLTTKQIDRMETAFEHEELKKALEGKSLFLSHASTKRQQKKSPRSFEHFLELIETDVDMQDAEDIIGRVEDVSSSTKDAEKKLRLGEALLFRLALIGEEDLVLLYPILDQWITPEEALHKPFAYAFQYYLKAVQKDELETLIEEKSGERQCSISEISLHSIAKNGDEFIIRCEVAVLARGGNKWKQTVDIIVSEESFRLTMNEKDPLV